MVTIIGWQKRQKENGDSFNMLVLQDGDSGTAQPSQADIQLTRRLPECGNFLDIAILDHIILGDEHDFSFADDGLL